MIFHILLNILLLFIFIYIKAIWLKVNGLLLTCQINRAIWYVIYLFYLFVCFYSYIMCNTPFVQSIVDSTLQADRCNIMFLLLLFLFIQWSFIVNMNFHRFLKCVGFYFTYCIGIWSKQSNNCLVIDFSL